jgi:hypothetical protein
MGEAIHPAGVPEFICDYPHHVEGPGGLTYSVRLYGVMQGRGIWDGWLIFFSDDGDAIRRTDREVEQESRQTLAQWGARLTSDYLQRAFARSHPFRGASTAQPLGSAGL